MNIREEYEKNEKTRLSEYAFKSSLSQGRKLKEEPDELRTCFVRDRDRIIHSKAFRRLKHKTQVFIAPEGDHYRTRLTHTLEVSQIARSIARALKLNEDLTEAIALGHDLGHTPFGHAGEKVLNSIMKRGFSHEIQSLRVVDVLEKNGLGLNLTYEVRDGILNHRTSGKPGTLEGQAVRFADKIAYINHDTDDSIRAGIISEKDIPDFIRCSLGETVHDRLNTLIKDLIYSSVGKERLQMSPETGEMMDLYRKWMFERIYTGSQAKSEEIKVERLIKPLFRFYMENTNEISSEYGKRLEESLNVLCEKYKGEELKEKEKDLKEEAVSDYISGMTDDFCISRFKEIFIPSGWKIKDEGYGFLA